MKPALPVLCLAAITTALPLSAQFTIHNLGDTYSQNFDSLPSSGTGLTWTDNSTLSSWYASAATYSATPGTNSSGMYSMGSTGSTERAFGGAASGATPVRVAVRLVNNTGSTITSLNLAYRGEQWRRESSVGTTISVDFQTFSSGAGSLSSGTWTGAGTGFTFTPTTTGTALAIDGNATGNFASISSTVAGLNWAPGTDLWIRWNVLKVSGQNLSLGVDNVALSGFSAIPEPSAFAALAGVGALGLAALRRRRAAR